MPMDLRTRRAFAFGAALRHPRVAAAAGTLRAALVEVSDAEPVREAVMHTATRLALTVAAAAHGLSSPSSGIPERW